LNAAFAMAILDLISRVHLSWNILIKYLVDTMEVNYVGLSKIIFAFLKGYSVE
jgi:fucose permease